MKKFIAWVLMGCVVLVVGLCKHTKIGAAKAGKVVVEYVETFVKPAWPRIVVQIVRRWWESEQQRRDREQHEASLKRLESFGVSNSLSSKPLDASRILFPLAGQGVPNSLPPKPLDASKLVSKSALDRGMNPNSLSPKLPSDEMLRRFIEGPMNDRAPSEIGALIQPPAQSKTSAFNPYRQWPFQSPPSQLQAPPDYSHIVPKLRLKSSPLSQLQMPTKPTEPKVGVSQETK